MNQYKIRDIINYNNLIWEVINTNLCDNPESGQLEQNINIDLINSDIEFNTWIFSRFAEKQKKITPYGKEILRWYYVIARV